MNILHEIPSESCQNPTTNSPSSNFSTTLGAWQNWRRSCRRSSSAARSTSPIGSPTSPGRNSELVQSHRNVIRIPSECHHELDGIIMGWDMTLWWNFGHHVIIMDININCTKQFQFETSQKTSQTMRYPWDNHGFRCHFVVIPTRPVRAQSTDGSAQQPGRVRFGSYGAAGASSATLLISWYLVNLNHIEPCWSEFSETYWQIEYWNIDIMIFNHHKHYIPLWTPHCRSVINPKN